VVQAALAVFLVTFPVHLTSSENYQQRLVLSMRGLSRAARNKAVVLRNQAPARARLQGRTPQLQVVAIQAPEESDVGSSSTFSQHIRVPSGTLPVVADCYSMRRDTPVLRAMTLVRPVLHYTAYQSTICLLSVLGLL
jgi:hypothetical protein